MENIKFMRPYPLWQLKYEQLPNGEKTTDIYIVSVKMTQNMNWYELYRTNSMPWGEIALKKLQDIFYRIAPSIFDDEENMPVMFEVNDQIYKTKYIFPQQSCIVGEDIPGNQRYGEYSIDGTKFDYVTDIIFFYNKGTCLVKGNQLFLDGELLFNSKDLKTKCDEIGQDFNKLDLYPEKLLDYLAKTYPSVTDYECGILSCHNIRKDRK